MSRGGRVTRVRAAVAIAALGLALPLLSGCTGDGESAAFHREFAGDSAIESMELTSHDNQPFTGGVSGDVLLRDGAGDEEFADLASRVGAYTRENGDRMRGRVSLIVDGYEMVVTGDEAVDGEAAGLLLALRADPRVASATVGEGAVAVVSDATASAIELAREVPGLLDAAAPHLPHMLAVRSADDAVDIMGAASLRSAAVQLWDALAAEVPLAGIRVRDDARIVVALRREADLSRAEAVAATEELDGVEAPAFASDVIRLGDSDGADARLLLSRLDDAARARIAYVWISDARVQVAVRTEADLAAMVETVDAALPPRISKATLVLDGDVETAIVIRP